MSGLSATSARKTGPGPSRGDSPLISRSNTPSGVGNPEATDRFTDRSKKSKFVPRNAPFHPSASIVLIGIRGVGKRTLGVLAATTYGRRLRDTERAFQEATGSSSSSYRQSQGHQVYQTKRNEVLKDLLDANSNGAVIICSFADLEGAGVGIIRDFSRTHPVVHVVRDAAGIHECITALSEERINDLLVASSPRMRACSNYEYFNLTEPLPDVWKHSPSATQEHDQQNPEQPSGRTLALKSVERDFMRMLRNIAGKDANIPAHSFNYPLSQVSLERRTQTLAVRMNVADVLTSASDIDQMQVGADCIELVFDGDSDKSKSVFQDIARAFATVRRATILPIMIHIRHKQHALDSAMPRIFELVEFALRLSPELCAFNFFLRDEYLTPLLASKGSCIAVGVMELETRLAQGWKSDLCKEQLQRATRLGCSSFKITMPATAVGDVFDIDRFRRDEQVVKQPLPLAAFGTGTMGLLSRCFNTYLTAVDPAVQRQGAFADRLEQQQCSTAKTLTQSLFANSIFEPLRYFVFGADVSYSLSPAMHNAAYEACGMQYTYEARSTNSLEDLKVAFKQPDFGGASVAQPFKTTVMPILHGASPHATIIGAVNTVIPVRELSRDGNIPDDLTLITRRHQQGAVKAFYGFNTDWIGIRACIRRGLSPANTVRAHSTAVVCGAGGMARAAVYSLLSLGVKNICICNRTLNHATSLADHYNAIISAGSIPDLEPSSNDQPRVHVLPALSSPWPQDLRQPTMIVSGIPRQEAGQPPVQYSLPEEWLKSTTGGVVLELAYRQAASPLADQIRAKARQGWIFMDGIDM
ncbi:uncharacterized protein LTR77_005465 [Saxophila tyrrhenica]|uniref:Quinate repressor protein n=1 Tax=Saxophila tyrrhenica TaxID=1690608 RepID=A0AAV9PBJ9_9PEZI|nr:hypothetical protein LTR77_005465 [Saxophila tyrrhenica]